MMPFNRDHRVLLETRIGAFEQVAKRIGAPTIVRVPWLIGYTADRADRVLLRTRIGALEQVPKRIGAGSILRDP
ncbi:unnamed protein product [Rotaria sp. Silwood2]|nr:unnamed protein product [Rotaria sp. Silwood2]